LKKPFVELYEEEKHRESLSYNANSRNFDNETYYGIMIFPLFLATKRCYNLPTHMQIINGKRYNECEIGGFILLIPVYGKQGQMFALGELKDFALKLEEIGKVAHEANKQMYLEAREKYISTRNRLEEINNQLSVLPKSDDIETIEIRKLLTEEKRKLESNLYYISERIDQLYHKDFVPEGKVKHQPEPVKKIPGIEEPTHDYTQTDGYKIQQQRKALGETQAQFARRFNIHPVHVSLWENNKEKPPKEVLEWQPTPSSVSEAEHSQELVGNAKN